MISSRSPILRSVVAAATISWLAAACGGGSSTTTGTTAHRSVLAYSQCMHAHGVPSFPDPGPSGGIDKAEIIALGNSPEINAASKTCAHVMPSTGLGPAQTGPPPQIRFADLLAFAKCLRRHDFPSFPDPTRSGELTHQMLANARIDLHQPAVVQAADACLGVTHGAITRATVARFIAGQ